MDREPAKVKNGGEVHHHVEQQPKDGRDHRHRSVVALPQRLLHCVDLIFQKQGCETRNQTFSSECLHPVEKVHAPFAYQVDELVGHVRSAF